MFVCSIANVINKVFGVEISFVDFFYEGLLPLENGLIFHCLG
jgi:hypothetical protein